MKDPQMSALVEEYEEYCYNHGLNKFLSAECLLDDLMYKTAGHITWLRNYTERWDAAMADYQARTAGM